MKKALSFFIMFALITAGGLTGRVLRVYTDFRKNPQMYAPPFESWLEELRLDFIIDGSVIIICIIAIIVLKVLLNKRKQQSLPEQTEA